MVEEKNNIKFHINFIGFGAPKCGTTWLAKCLNEHPEICMPEDEMDFFNKSHGYGSIETEWYYKRGMGWYYSRFQHCSKEKLIGEFSPKYLFDDEAPKLIYEHFPDVKLIAVLRHPVDRLYSLHKHIKSKRSDALGTFEEAIQDPAFLESSKYYHQLKRYFDLFPRERIGIFFYEDLAKDQEKFTQSVYNFLGVDDSFTPPSVSIKLNTSEQRASSAHYKTHALLFKTTRALKRNPVTRFFIATGKKFKLDILTFKLIDAFTLKQPTSEKKTGIDPETRERLDSFYAEDIKKTEQLLGYDIEQWH